MCFVFHFLFVIFPYLATVSIPLMSSSWNEGERRNWNEERMFRFRHLNKLQNSRVGSQVFICKIRRLREERFS